MSDSASDPTQDFAAWLASQGDVLQRLAREQDPARLRADLEAWWRRAGAHAGPDSQQLAARLFDLGEQYLRGLKQFALAASGESGGEKAGAFNFGLDLLATWRKARWGGGSGLDTASAMFAPWLDAIAKLPANGPAGAFVNDARELTALHAQCQRIEASLMLILGGVQHRALADLQSQIVQRGQANAPLRNFHDLYDLWVECGERAYARAAHDAEFIRLQAEYANHALRMRGLQRRLAERMARTLDLPTRAEVNSLHLQVRDLKRRFARYEESGAEIPPPSVKSTKTKARRP